jgi:hypothetical protein
LPLPSRILAMGTTDRELTVMLAGVLRGLVDYVEQRTEDHTDDDDVRALEDVAAALQEASPEAKASLRGIWGPEWAEMVGLH